MRAQGFAFVVAAALLVSGCLQSDAPEANGPRDMDDGGSTKGVPDGPFAVIGVVDTGINPYHEAFRDDSPRAWLHPSLYLPDYPADAVALNITFSHDSLSDAVAADCAQWEKVEPGRFYWFPGTRIVGAVTNPVQWEDLPYQDSTRGKITCGDTDRKAWGNIFGNGGHGTAVTSRAAADGYGACPECLIASVQGLGPWPVRWVADQPWIDLSSHSWGPQVPLVQPSGMPVPRLASDSELVAAVEDAARRQTAFYASGNGILFRYGTLGHPTQGAAHMTPSAIRVGGHDNARVMVWHGSSPHVVADACGGWSALHESMSGAGPHPSGGTSLAAPYAAGLAAKVLLEARRLLQDNRTGVRDGVLAEGRATGSGPLVDGVLTKQEFERVVLTTATTAPEPGEHDGYLCDPTRDPLGNPTYLIIPTWPVWWRDLPDTPAQIPIIGYGAVTNETVAHAALVLRGEASMPERTAEDAYFAGDRTFRETMHVVYTALP